MIRAFYYKVHFCINAEKNISSKNILLSIMIYRAGRHQMFLFSAQFSNQNQTPTSLLFPKRQDVSSRLMKSENELFFLSAVFEVKQFGLAEKQNNTKP